MNLNLGQSVDQVGKLFSPIAKKALYGYVVNGYFAWNVAAIMPYGIFHTEAEPVVDILVKFAHSICYWQRVGSHWVELVFRKRGSGA